MFLGARFPASPTSRVKADENKILVKRKRSDHRKTLAGTRKIDKWCQMSETEVLKSRPNETSFRLTQSRQLTAASIALDKKQCWQGYTPDIPLVHSPGPAGD